MKASHSPDERSSALVSSRALSGDGCQYHVSGEARSRLHPASGRSQLPTATGPAQYLVTTASTSSAVPLAQPPARRPCPPSPLPAALRAVRPARAVPRPASPSPASSTSTRAHSRRSSPTRGSAAWPGRGRGRTGPSRSLSAPWAAKGPEEGSPARTAAGQTKARYAPACRIGAAEAAMLPLRVSATSGGGTTRWGVGPTTTTRRGCEVGREAGQVRPALSVGQSVRTL